MISIVLPVYNQIEWIRETLKCIQTQTYHDFELIIVDDGSTDGSSEVLKEFSTSDSRVHYYYKENGGTGSALNLGFSYAKGEFGTWISGDNLYSPTVFDALVTALKEHPQCGLSFSSFSIRYQNGANTYGEKNIKRVNFKGLVPGIVENFIQLSFLQCITGICYLFRMDLKRECGDFINCMGEDYLMGVKMGLKTKVFYVKDALGIWRGHLNCLTVYSRNEPSLLIDKITGLTANQMVQNLINESSS